MITLEHLMDLLILIHNFDLILFFILVRNFYIPLTYVDLDFPNKLLAKNEYLLVIFALSYLQALYF